MLRFDPTITFGTLVQMIVFLGGIAIFAFKIDKRLALVEFMISQLWQGATGQPPITDLTKVKIRVK